MSAVAQEWGSAGASDVVREIDWRQAGEEALELLRHYLRFPTVNDPDSLAGGCEAEAAHWLAGELAADGIQTELLEAAPGRTNLVARLGGEQRGGSITLLSHSDVVPARREEWSHDPFGAEIHDGFVFGRGVLDLKGLGIAQALALKLLRRSGVPLRREVRLIVAADEEAGGHHGTEWLLQERPELLDTGLVLGEGAYSLRGFLPEGAPLHAIAVGEKGYLELEVIAEEAAHHASMPDADHASARLVRALARLLARERPIRLTPLVRELLPRLGESSRGPAAFLMRHPALAVRLAPGHLRRSTLLRAMVQDTVAVTVLAAGSKPNVVPGMARAILSLRFLPGTDPEELGEEIRRALGDSRLRIVRRMLKPSTASGFAGPAETDFVRLRRHATASSPGAVAVPICSPGASDCRFFRLRGVPAYGWIPFVIPLHDLHSVHGPDERLSIAELQAGLRSYFGLVLDLATRDGRLGHDE